MEDQKLEQLRRRMHNRWPVVGPMLRRKAAAELAADVVPGAVRLLVEALADDDQQVQTIAGAALRGLKQRDAVDALCTLAIAQPAGAAARLCVETGKRHSDPEQAALLLFVTRQLDDYFREDVDFQFLRAAYDRAGEAVRAQVMDVVRGGDRRCLGFFGRRKPLSECSNSEIKLAIDSALRHRDWPRLFRAFQEMPLKYGFPLIEEFRRSGWEPEQTDLKVLYKGVLAESKGDTLPPPSPANHSSPAFEKWLAEGRSGELSRLHESDLLARLKAAAPPEGVKTVAALATKATPGSAAAQAVHQSEHWLVRLAGYATGLCVIEDLTSDKITDDNRWIQELVRSVGVLEFWPVKATPADLENLNAAPREAFTGQYGAVRRVLRLLLAQRVTAGEVTEIVFEAGEFAGEFTEA